MKRTLSIASFAGGFSVMGAEVASGRLLAPSFGTSTLVWSALIGVVLGGMAIGAMLGGRWSRRPTALREAFAAMTAAGVLLVAIPAVTRPLMRATLAHFLRGDVAVLVLGFASVLAIIVAPVILLGAMSPVLVHHATSERSDVGRTSGALGALGTIGSLTGTFVCGVVLVPLAGTEATFGVCGGVALGVGAIGTWLALRASGARLPVPRARRLAIAAAALLAVVVIATLRRGDVAPGVVFEAETAHGHVRVVDDRETRTLYLDEGYAKQSVARLDGRAYLRGVWGYYAIAPAFAKTTPSRILVVGLGGGTSARDYAQRLPNAEVVAVELDAGVVDVARRYFALPPSVEVHTEDARAFLARDARAYDLVVVDAFQFPYVPFQLSTREFFEEVRRHLAAGGALVVNAGRKGQELDVVHAVASTLQAVFPHVSGVNVLRTTNTILVATAHPLDEAGGARNVRFTAREQIELDELAPLSPWTVPADKRLVLTDDVAPIEWLTNRIVVRELFGPARPTSAPEAS